MHSYLRISVIACAGLLASEAHSQDAATGMFGVQWSHPSFPGFEPPASGPGPVVNTVRRPQTVDADGRSMPPNSNILVSAFGTALVGDTRNPILKPNAAEIVKQHGEMSLKGSFPTPTTQCWPEPVPYILASVGVQMLPQKDAIVFLYPNDHQIRRIRMNSSHPREVTPSWYGDSIGRYEGDTFVIDTVGVKLGPFPMVDWYGTPYSSALHVVERYRLIDYEEAKEGLERDMRENVRLLGADAASAPVPGYRGKHLQLLMTVEDDGVFTMPWTATMTYRPGVEAWREIVCAENQYELTIAGRDGAVPMANKPDF